MSINYERTDTLKTLHKVGQYYLLGIFYSNNCYSEIHKSFDFLMSYLFSVSVALMKFIIFNDMRGIN